MSRGDYDVETIDGLDARARATLAWSGEPSTYPRDAGLALLYEAHVRARPDAVAVRTREAVVSYAELDARASRLGNLLRARGVGLETPVGVLMGTRIEHVMAQVALCKLGATCVPLDPVYPRARVAWMTRDAGVSLILTDASSREVSPDGAALLCLDDDAVQIAGRPAECASADAGAGTRTHILYTSGSTGRPKGIEVVGRAISRLVLDTDYVEIGPSDRVAQLASFSFDAALFEVWGPLLRGASTVLLPKRRLIDPHTFRADLAEMGITVMFLTTALFNVTAQACPDAFRGLRYLLVGGERANARTMRAVLEAAPPERLMHVYGPTESTVFATAHRLDLDEVRGETASIGRPIRDTRVFILGSDLAPVPPETPGELCIGGDGLARGYLGRPDLTAERFVDVDGLDPSGPIRIYRTGDQASWRSDGAIDFLGRTDHQIKLHGFRIELEELEAALVDTKLVRAAVAGIETRGHGERSLVAWVVPRDEAKLEPEVVLVRLRDHMPAYMIPARLRVVAEIPLNTNGKVDRKALGALERAPAVVERATTSACSPEAAVAEIWAELLGGTAAEDDDFFAGGGDSLLAARLVLRVHEVLGVRVPVYALYAASTLRGFTQSVRAALRGRMPEDFGQGDASMWRRDARLPVELAAELDRSLRAGPPRARDLSEARVILLTGATGFLGVFLLRELLENTDAEILCLVRARSEPEGLARIEAALARYELSVPLLRTRVRPVLGDLRARDLGLQPAVHAALADELDAIIHSGAQVNYVQPYDSHRATNVLGTLEILRLAARGRITPVHHVSTISVFGPCGFLGGIGRIPEDAALDPFAEYLRYDIGYSQSKWVCEQLVWAAHDCGAPVCVYRPGFIMGDSRTGAGNPDDFVARLIQGCIQVGAAPQLPRQRKELVPVDYVSRLLVGIASRPDCIGHAYHLVPPDPDVSIDLDDFFALIDAVGYPLESIPYADWVERLLADPRLTENGLLPVLPMLCEQIYRDATTRWELYEDMPVYDAARSVVAAASCGAVFQPMTAEVLSRYLDFWIGCGHLPSRRPR